MKFVIIIAPVLLLAASPGIAIAAAHGSGQSAERGNAGGPERCLYAFPNRTDAWQYWSCNVGFAA
jgi:hypothetical protein